MAQKLYVINSDLVYVGFCSVVNLILKFAHFIHVLLSTLSEGLESNRNLQNILFHETHALKCRSVSFEDTAWIYFSPKGHSIRYLVERFMDP